MTILTFCPDCAWKRNKLHASPAPVGVDPDFVLAANLMMWAKVKHELGHISREQALLVFRVADQINPKVKAPC